MYILLLYRLFYQYFVVFIYCLSPFSYYLLSWLHDVASICISLRKQRSMIAEILFAACYLQDAHCVYARQARSAFIGEREDERSCVIMSCPSPTALILIRYCDHHCHYCFSMNCLTAASSSAQQSFLKPLHLSCSLAMAGWWDCEYPRHRCSAPG